MPIPSLQLKQKTCLMQRSKGFGHGVAVLKICYNILIVLPCDHRSGAASLSAAHITMFAKCDAVPKEIRGLRLFQESIPAIPPYEKLEVPESGSASGPSLCCS